MDTGTFEAQNNSGGISQVNTHIYINTLQAFTAHDHLADQRSQSFRGKASWTC